MKNFEDNTSKERDSTHYDVLIISDNQTTIRLITSYFELNNCTCKAFTSGAEALKDMQTNLPRLIIMDELLRDVSGYEILRTIKSNERLKNISIRFFLEKTLQQNIEITRRSKERFGEDVVDFFKF